MPPGVVAWVLLGPAGSLVLDPVSAPKWRLDCNRCNFLVYLPPNLHTAKVSKEECEVGGCMRPCRYAHNCEP
jgi:hypothetical protein